MIEFLIRYEDEDAGVHVSRAQEALAPNGFACEVAPGFGKEHFKMTIDAVETWFSPEDGFWQVSFKNPPSAAWASKVAQGICESLCRVSGQICRVVPI